MKTYSLFSALVAGILIYSSAAEAKPRSCRLVYPDRPQDGLKVAYLHDGNVSHRVNMPSMNLSDVIHMPIGEIKISMTPAAVTDPELVPPNAPQLMIPEEMTDFYIIIRTDPDNEVIPIRMEILNASDAKLKIGETLWRNFTNDRIIARLGSQEVTLAPMGQVISPPPAPASGYFNASFTFQEGGEEDEHPITEQSWWHDANSRHLGLILNSGGKLPKIFYYRDFRL